MQTFIIAALTADGFIAREIAHSSVSWRSKADHDFFIKTTLRAGVVVMGATTFGTMKRPMPDRLHIVYSHDPINLPNVEVTSKEPKEVLADLQNRGYREIAICGGATIYTMFMEARVVDKLYLTIEPVLFGFGIRLFNRALDSKLKLVAVENRDGTVFLEYDVVT